MGHSIKTANDILQQGERKDGGRGGVSQNPSPQRGDILSEFQHQHQVTSGELLCVLYIPLQTLENTAKARIQVFQKLAEMNSSNLSGNGSALPGSVGVLRLHSSSVGKRLSEILDLMDYGEGIPLDSYVPQGRPFNRVSMMGMEQQQYPTVPMAKSSRKQVAYSPNWGDWAKGRALKAGLTDICVMTTASGSDIMPNSKSISGSNSSDMSSSSSNSRNRWLLPHFQHRP
ncbi:hypothetical protein SKAU_G00274690 [Synaphobranchus kaupii]|uniref:Uncharacterized protein n=1 Tax=Synaphobranchus kaupii TaxID=118154 RepID=A0A9Q1F105_SYNKA|nr:hypothetical protein SKAU_G00274690 [Synaphobranchus kaupii]